EAFTLAAWVRGRGNLPMNGFQKIESADRRRGYEWQFDDITLVDIQRWAARLTIRIASDSPDSAIEIRSRDRLRLGDWYHGAVTYDGSGKAAGLTLYVNGGRAAVDVVRDTLRGPIRSNAPLRLGSKTLGKPFVGQIDDLRLYARALTSGQVDDLAVHYPVRAI